MWIYVFFGKFWFVRVCWRCFKGKRSCSLSLNFILLQKIVGISDTTSIFYLELNIEISSVISFPFWEQVVPAVPYVELEF